DSGAEQNGGSGEKLGIPPAAEFTRDEDGERDKCRAGERGKDAQRPERSAHEHRDFRVNGNQRGGIDVAPVEVAGHVEVIKLIAEVAVVPDTGEEVQQQLGCTEANQNANCERRKRRSAALLAWLIGEGLSSASDSHNQNCAPPHEALLSWFLSEYFFRTFLPNPARS